MPVPDSVVPLTWRVTTLGSALAAMPATLSGARPPLFFAACGSSTVVRPPLRSM